MNAENLKQLTTDALDQLSAALEQGHSERLAAMLKAMAQFHHYSWHNVCLIASQRPEATRVAQRLFGRCGQGARCALCR